MNITCFRWIAPLFTLFFRWPPLSKCLSKSGQRCCLYLTAPSYPRIYLKKTTPNPGIVRPLRRQRTAHYLHSLSFKAHRISPPRRAPRRCPGHDWMKTRGVLCLPRYRWRRARYGLNKWTRLGQIQYIYKMDAAQRWASQPNPCCLISFTSVGETALFVHGRARRDIRVGYFQHQSLRF